MNLAFSLAHKHLRIAFLVFVTAIISSCSNCAYPVRISHILGNKDIEVASCNSFDSFGGFGEGITIREYIIDTKTPLTLKGKRLPVQDSRFKTINWTNQRLSEKYEELYIMALSHVGNGHEISEKLALITSILKNNTTYHAFYYYPDEINAQDVDMLVFDGMTNTLYIISSSI